MDIITYSQLRGKLSTTMEGNSDMQKKTQKTLHIRSEGELESFIQTIRKLVQEGKELTITVSSEDKNLSNNMAESEQEKLFYSLFGSWEGDETADEMVRTIYGSRVSRTREIEL